MVNGEFLSKSPRIIDQEMTDLKKEKQKEIPTPWATEPYEINEYEWYKVLESTNKARRRSFWNSIILVCYFVLEVLDYFFPDWGLPI